MNNLTIIATLFVLTACAGTEEQRYQSQDTYNTEADEFRVFTESCKRMGGRVFIPHQQSSRIKRGYTLEDMRTAVCEA